MAKSKNAIKKENWVSNFNLVGKPVIGDYTYRINERSQKSDWIYNSMNLLLDCGEKHGRISCEMMGGYSLSGNSVIYAHGKDENGRDDFSNQMQIAWEDRNDEDVLEEVGDMNFITVGLEKDNNGKTYYKKFLSEYDAIEYINEHLSEDMVVRVRGNLKYSLYNDNTQIRKNITSIVLSNISEPEDFSATFTQSILIDKDSVILKDADKEKGVLNVDAYVLDYIKELDGVEIRGQYPFPYTFEFPVDLSDATRCKKLYDKLFKVKKDVNQITFDGEFVEGGSTVSVSWDDVPDDIKQLVDVGVYTKKEVLDNLAQNGPRERRMLLKKPTIRMVGEDDKKTPVIQIFEGVYTEDELDAVRVSGEDDGSDDDIPFEKKENGKAGSSGDDDMSWLDEL